MLSFPASIILHKLIDGILSSKHQRSTKGLANTFPTDFFQQSLNNASIDSITTTPLCNSIHTRKLFSSERMITRYRCLNHFFQIYLPVSVLTHLPHKSHNCKQTCIYLWVSWANIALTTLRTNVQNQRRLPLHVPSN